MQDNRKKFTEAWNNSETVKEVAKKMGLTYGSTRTLAWRYRREGLDLPLKPSGVRK